MMKNPSQKPPATRSKASKQPQTVDNAPEQAIDPYIQTQQMMQVLVTCLDSFIDRQEKLAEEQDQRHREFLQDQQLSMARQAGHLEAALCKMEMIEELFAKMHAQKKESPAPFFV